MLSDLRRHRDYRHHNMMRYDIGFLSGSPAIASSELELLGRTAIECSSYDKVGSSENNRRLDPKRQPGLAM